jgi:hypothetical protein
MAGKSLAQSGLTGGLSWANPLNRFSVPLLTVPADWQRSGLNPKYLQMYLHAWPNVIH